MSLPQRGGPLSYALYIAKGCSVASSSTPKVQRVSNQWQNRAKVNFFLLGLVFSRDFRRPKRAKSKYILKVGAGGAVLVVGCLPAFIVSTCAGLPAFEGAGPARGGLWSPGGVFPAFCPLSCLAFGALPLKYAFIRVFSAFLAWFGVVVWVCLSWRFLWLVWLLCA